jgi:hypothetical protein
MTRRGKAWAVTTLAAQESGSYLGIALMWLNLCQRLEKTPRKKLPVVEVLSKSLRLLSVTQD